MSIRLFHRTTAEGAEDILREGFRAGPRGDVWLSRNNNAWGVNGRRLLEVLLEIGEDELEVFGKDAVVDEDYDPETGEWSPTPDGGFVMRLRWYEIPADLVNARGTVSEVDPRSIEFDDE